MADIDLHGFKPGTYPAKFLQLAGGVDKKGFSRKVPLVELLEEGLGFGNGASWARDDGTLAKKFNIQRFKEGKGNKTTAVQLMGLKQNPRGSAIPAHIRKEITSQRCPVLNTRGPCVDHKDGFKLDPALRNPNIDQFQPLSKAANTAKREHCKLCRNTRKRFDARNLGFSIGWTIGDENYVGTCVGCYWYDVRDFHNEVST